MRVFKKFSLSVPEFKSLTTMQLNEEKTEAIHVVVYLHSIEKVISLLRLVLMDKKKHSIVLIGQKEGFFSFENVSMIVKRKVYRTPKMYGHCVFHFKEAGWSKN